MVKGKRAEKPPTTNGGDPQTPPGEVAAEQEGPKANDASVALTPEQEFGLLCHWRRQYQESLGELSTAKTEHDSAKMRHKALGKKIAAECGTDAVERIKALIELDTNENGEAELEAKIRRLMWVAKWSKAAIGHQIELFDTDMRPIDERAFDEGKIDGLAGKFNPKFGQGTAAYHKYQEGYETGQDTLAKGFKPLEKPPEDIGAPAETAPA